ncbi:GGDEF domain-containing protein [Alteromonas halophila]|uniref:diguanylate cyclase n=1 Tax=Alteromonas halophila TaxID=516698 RepID=A0A918JH48_9ALTE|nr:GGDEF domain-containing protein [Alteromonas halophila]GGW81232.1 hypothetical protein GCM10007391_12980 [Alteromonas halophila]
MSISAFILFQAALLVLIALVGVIFTCALPTPSQKHKAMAAHYARGFMLSMCLAQLCLSMRHTDYAIIYLLGYNLFLLVSAYLLFVTVVKRYGHALRYQQMWLISMHIVVLEVLTLVFAFYYDSEPVRDMLMLVSCVVPIVLAMNRVRLVLSRDSVGDKVLLLVLAFTLFTIAVVAPVYLTLIAGSEFEQTVMGLLMVVLLQLFFIVGFAVSVVQSLVNRLNKKVYTDALTKARNRHYFYNMAPKISENAAASRQSLAAILCDIDHFKAINDTHGHVVGDKALQHFTQVLQAELRKSDMLVRMGGEEFLVVLRNCDIHRATQLAERLRASVTDNSLIHQGKSVSVTASFGVVEIVPGADIFKSLNLADQALYKAKATGRNQVIAIENKPA